MVNNNYGPENGVEIPSLAQGEKIVVRFSRDAGIRFVGTEFASVQRADVSALNACIARHSGVTVERVFSQTDDTLAREVESLEAATGQGLPQLAGYYSITAANSDQAEAILNELEGIDYVERAYREPPALPAIFDAITLFKSDEASPATDDFNTMQGYLNLSPEGVDARYAWTVAGGEGDKVKVMDIEGAWNFVHEDLLHNQGGVVGGSATTNADWENHGTAVQGEIAGDENGFGIRGIAPSALFSGVSIFGEGNSPAKAIKTAADKLDAGDIILIELHRAGPNSTGSGQFGFIPIEWWDAEFASVKYATAKGIIVIAAAGNGSQNLDDEVYEGKFDRGQRDSGAILVGAGAPPSGNHGPDRSRLGFSNYGAIIDAQGWGREVTATGYGDLQGGTDKNKWYTNLFSGTSSASPIIVGAVSCIQGIHKTRGCSPLTPAEIRDALRKTGSPQTSATGRPSTQRIGNRPNIREALAYLDDSDNAGPPPRPLVYANGKVFVNDKPAQDGLILFARIDDYETEHKPELKDGGYEFLKVTPSDEKYIGRTVKFFLRDSNGVQFQARETDTFEEGKTKFGFDLHAERKEDDGDKDDGRVVVRSAEAEALSAAAQVVAGLASSGSVTEPSDLSTATTTLFNDYLKLLKKPEEAAASAEHNQDIVNRFYEECVNRGNVGIADQLFALTYISHTPEGDGHFPYSPKQSISALRNAFPDLEVTVEDQVADEDTVVSRLVLRGTHKGQYRGIPATDRRVTWTSIDMHKFSEGKIVEEWRISDGQGLMEQLGAAPA